MDGWTQTLSAGWLLGIAAMAIVLILLLIVKLRVHALLTLVSVSLLTAVATGLPMDKIVNDVLLKTSAARSAAWRCWSVWAQCSAVWWKLPAVPNLWRMR